MQKVKEYHGVALGPDAVAEILEAFRSVVTRAGVKIANEILNVDHDDSEWTYDSIAEFLAAYRKYRGGCSAILYCDNYELMALVSRQWARLAVSAPKGEDIETVFNVVERHAATSTKALPVIVATVGRPLVVFIGHGRSRDWRDLKDHLHDKHGIKVVA